MNEKINFLYNISSCGCTFFNSNDAQRQVKDETQKATSDLREGYFKRLDTLNKIYGKTINNIHDTLLKNNAMTYYFELKNTIKYIDSLKLKLKNLDRSGHEANLVKDVFINDNAGKMLYDKLNLSYIYALKASKTGERRNQILKSRSNLFNKMDVNQFSNFFFGQDDPEQATWTLYGFEYEI